MEESVLIKSKLKPEESFFEHVRAKYNYLEGMGVPRCPRELRRLMKALERDRKYKIGFARNEKERVAETN